MSTSACPCREVLTNVGVVRAVQAACTLHGSWQSSTPRDIPLAERLQQRLREAEERIAELHAAVTRAEMRDLANATTEDLKVELARRSKPATTVPALLPREKIRKFGRFHFHIYVATHDLLDGDRRLPLWLFVGARRTHRGARRLATQKLAERPVPNRDTVVECDGFEQFGRALDSSPTGDPTDA